VYEGSVFLYAHQHLLLVVFLMMAALIEVSWNLSVVSICIFFKARDGEHFFMCLWTFSFEKVMFSSVANLFIGLLIFKEFNFLSFYILVLSPLSDVELAENFPPLCG
jgi:hypothetical protein